MARPQNSTADNAAQGKPLPTKDPAASPTPGQGQPVFRDWAAI